MSAFVEHLARSWPPDNWREAPVLVAVSGGADSVALLRGLATLREPGASQLKIAHFNHQTRGAETDDDETFVRSLAEHLGLPFHAGHPSGGAGAWDTRDGFEAAARAARYAFFVDVAQKTGARYVAVAHTADDQAETVLHRVLRGTGIAGLAGMPRARVLAPGVSLIRPLLSFRREEVRAYLRQINQPWREDASNTNLDWTRNRIRNELLPLLAREYNPAVTDALLRLGHLARETQQVIDCEVEAMLDEAIQNAGPQEATIRLGPLRGKPEYLVCETFIALWRRQGWPRRHYGREQWRRLAELAQATTSAETAITLPGAIHARREGELLHLNHADADQA